MHRRSARLPERLSGSPQALLVALEAAALLFVSLIALSATPNAIVAAIVSAAVFCGIAWASGMYQRSYAVYPGDEAYYACSCAALTAVPLIFLLNVVGGVPLGFVAAMLVLGALASSIVRIRLHLERRTTRLSPTLHSISPHGWTDRERPRYRIAKHAFDLIAAGLALVPLCLLMGLAAIAIRIDSGRPVLFRQQRVGRDGTPFLIYKFRTMAGDADSSWVKPHDERITRIGAFLRRFSLDELPQIFNVLRGEMSIVGPRPEMIEFARQFVESIPNYAQRHVVMPGVTGWAQLYYKRSPSPSEEGAVLAYDLFYVEHASIIVDCALILKTIVELLAHRPA